MGFSVYIWVIYELVCGFLKNHIGSPQLFIVL